MNQVEQTAEGTADERYKEILEHLRDAGAEELVVDLDNAVAERLVEAQDAGRGRDASGGTFSAQAELQDVLHMLGLIFGGQEHHLEQYRSLTREAMDAASRCVTLVEDLRRRVDETSEEVVTRRLRVVDEHDRTWIDAREGEVRCLVPDDTGTWVGMSAGVDHDGRSAGLWLSRRGEIVGCLTTKKDAWLLDPTSPGAALDILTADGSPVGGQPVNADDATVTDREAAVAKLDAMEVETAVMEQRLAAIRLDLQSQRAELS